MPGYNDEIVTSPSPPTSDVSPLSEIYAGVPRPDAGEDAARWYVEARVRGVAVEHTSEVRGFTWDGLGDTVGTFRTFGVAQFNWNSRRWTAFAFEDCSAVELVSLITATCRYADEYGQKPGSALRGSRWHHHRTLHSLERSTREARVAEAWLTHRLTAEDLLASTEAEADIPHDISALRELGDAYVARAGHPGSSS